MSEMITPTLLNYGSLSVSLTEEDGDGDHDNDHKADNDKGDKIEEDSNFKKSESIRKQPANLKLIGCTICFNVLISMSLLCY
jgi:hypothetical protein